MNIKDLQINCNPTEKDLSKLKEWLKFEDKIFNEGFYCNWININTDFKSKKLFILQDKSECIGFCTYSGLVFSCKIELFQIKKELRGKGIGEYFFKQVENKIKEEEFKVLKLTCSPINSEGFWRKMGLHDLPETDFTPEYLTLYKPLIKTSKPNITQTNYRIELWNKEINGEPDCLPTWSWNILKESFMLEFPILHPCSCNWKIRLIRNGKKIKDDKVKYFFEKKRINDVFLYLDNLEME